MKLPPPLPENNGGIERFKRQEKEKAEKPFERPVEPVDHDQRRHKFREAGKTYPSAPVKKEPPKKEVDPSTLHPSLFQLARSSKLHESVEEALDEKKEKKKGKEEEEIAVATPPRAIQTQLYFETYIKPDLIEAVSSKEEPLPPINQNEVIELIEQMVKALQIYEKSDVVETRVTLQHPPLFEGVSFVIREEQTAQRQFTLTFENLTNPDARLLIEQPHSEALLRAALLEKGYVLQMVTIEPKLEFAITEVQEIDKNLDFEDENNKKNNK